MTSNCQEHLMVLLNLVIERETVKGAKSSGSLNSACAFGEKRRKNTKTTPLLQYLTLNIAAL